MAVIGLDGTGISIYGKGISRYQFNLIRSLAKLDKKNYYYVFLNKKNIIPELPKQNNFHYVRIYIPKRIIWDHFQLPFFIINYKLDIYHSLIDTLPIFSKGKFVLSVTEIPDYRIELTHRLKVCSLYTRLSQKYNKLCFYPSLSRASLIIVNSNSTKNDLTKKYKLDEKKIKVLYLAPDDKFHPVRDEKEAVNTRKRYNAENGYILHISSSDIRDNTLMAIRSFERLRFKSRITQKLIIVGDVTAREVKLRKLITELNLEDSIIFTGYLLEEELTLLYQAADLFLDLSLYEGFGLQVVEAMACGIPVIASNVTSLPEIVGDAGILVNPTDIDRLLSALTGVLTDSRFRNHLCQKSLERAKFFTWDKTARQTQTIYEELVRSK